MYRLAAQILSATTAFASHEARARQASQRLQVDLGYSIYQGYKDTNSQLNTWKGIRYAQAPLGDLRWNAPKSPLTNRTSILDAQSDPPRCPQCPQSPGTSDFDFSGNEDCLFLNVFAPADAKDYPVLFYIHGGGYGAGNAGFDPSVFEKYAGNKIVAVSIQYRLSAFGFLAGTAVRDHGTANAGLLDQHLALQWVQDHIAKFGGDPRKVTVAAQSAGAGSVQLQALAYGGSEGTKYFLQGIASSPYTPATYAYNDQVPEERYLRFAKAAGCFTGDTSKPDPDAKVLACLRNASTDALQRANFGVGSGVNYGSWAFTPVVDGTFVKQSPSQQLQSGQINGNRILTSNNANEGSQFVTPTITSAPDFNAWLLTEYPHLSQSDIDQINKNYYPYTDTGTTPYATCGDCIGGATAVDVGSYATGHRQRAIALYSEATFVCPSFWLASAYSKGGYGKAAYKYQFSIPPSNHGLDLVAEGFGILPNAFAPEIGPDFGAALTSVWVNFILNGNPSISAAIANGNAKHQTGTGSCYSAGKYGDQNPVVHWPAYESSGDGFGLFINLNQTGGSPGIYGGPTICAGDDVRNAFRTADGETWEGGLGKRCAFLRSTAAFAT